MAEAGQKLSIILKRPIDVAPTLMDAFFDLMAKNEDVTKAEIRLEFAGTEMFFFCGTSEMLAGMLALRYANAKAQRRIFEQAGAGEMWNPYSIESRRLFVHPDFAGQGIAQGLKQQRAGYLQDRPAHEIVRAEEPGAADVNFHAVGDKFTLADGGPEYRLQVHNHDAVLDTSKRIIYG